MKRLITAVVAVGLMASQACAEEKTVLKDQKDKVSYSIGLDIGKSFKKQSIEVNSDLLFRGIKDGLAEAKPLMTDEEMRAAMMAFQQELMAKHTEMQTKLAEKNKKEGEAFLEANRKKEGIKTTPSGLQYKVVKEGDGPTPKPTDTVTVHYTGTLIDGTEFDSSYKRGQPASFPVNGVIPGWTEALQLMKSGAKWQLVIPADLAYGERGAGQQIGPNAVLVFDVELLSVKEDKHP
ncbi:MAG: FKBP-type peptidyl-prolyl cis-trans isomerase [Nitrospirota bacterium]